MDKMENFFGSDLALTSVDTSQGARERKIKAKQDRMHSRSNLQKSKSSNGKPKLSVDYERAVVLARSAVGMLERKEFPFNLEDTLPDVALPESVGGIADADERARAHSNYLLIACSLDSAVQARALYRSCRQMVDCAGGVERFLMMGVRRRKQFVSKFLDMAHLHNPSGTVEENIAMLKRVHGGDARRIFSDSEDYRAHIEALRKFRQVGDGKAALILKNMVRFGYATLEDVFDFPIKIDRHAMKIALGVGVVLVEPASVVIDKWVRPLLEGVFRRVTKEQRISPISLNDALYGIGSVLCSKNSIPYCEANCGIEPKCLIRPHSDHYASYLDVSRESRSPRRQTGLFDNLKE